MFRLPFLGNGWADCIEIWSYTWGPIGYSLCSSHGWGISARAHCASVSQERLGRLGSILVCERERERERETIYFRIGHKHVLGHTRIGVKAPGALNTGRRSFGLHHQFLETKLCHLVSITSSKTTSKEKRKKNNIHHTQYTSTFAICRSFSS